MIPLPDLSSGTVPLADVFWFCGGQRVCQSLPAEWQGCCALVWLDSKTPVLLVSDQPLSGRSHSRRDAALWTQYVRDANTTSYSDWAPDETICLDFGGTPVGVPAHYKAMEAVGSGMAPILFPAMQINPNAAWINYMWYNQQRFINYSVSNFGLIRDQLYATSLMAAQNRFVLDQMRASEEGVCIMIGPECCAAIPLHTSAEGALSKVLIRLQALQEEQVANSGFGTCLRLPP